MLSRVKMTETIYTTVQTMAAKLYKKHRECLKYGDVIESMLNEIHVNLHMNVNMNLGSWSPDFKHGGSMYTSFTSKILPLPETIINGFGHQQIIDKNHFMMQIFRIPLNEECTLANLLRIAAYTGFLASNMKADDFPEGIVRTFKALNLHAAICYVDAELPVLTKEQLQQVAQSMVIPSY